MATTAGDSTLACSAIFDACARPNPPVVAGSGSGSAALPIMAPIPALTAILPCFMSSLPLRVLSVIPPMTQLNTPYPSTAYLTGFLRSREVTSFQEDLALALVLRLLSADGLRAVAERVAALPANKHSPAVQSFVAQQARYLATIGPVIAFLQGRDSTLAHRIVGRHFLPEGPRFSSLDVYLDEDGGDPLGWAFGALGLHDRAKHLATLYLNDLADVLRDAVDPRFEFVRYAESLAGSQPTFDPLAQALVAPPTLVDDMLRSLTSEALARHTPTVVLLSVPFPGAVYAAFRIAQTIKVHDPGIVTVLGGGFVNTELRELKDPRVFDYFDYVTLDAGERPLLSLLEHLQGKRSRQRLVRTFLRDADTGAVRYVNMVEPDIAFAEVGTPTWDGLPLDRYLSLLDMLNPMNRLWSDGRWNKLTVAHGCYWKARPPRCWPTASRPSCAKPGRPVSTLSTRPRRPSRSRRLRPN
jgi:hypothetical protein